MVVVRCRPSDVQEVLPECFTMLSLEGRKVLADQNCQAMFVVLYLTSLVKRYHCWRVLR